jgi:hypothetical protein
LSGGTTTTTTTLSGGTTTTTTTLSGGTTTTTTITTFNYCDLIITCIEPETLKIFNAEVNCLDLSVTISVMGGTPNYEYSIDNGLTFTAPTSSQSYTFTGLSEGSYDVFVRDANGDYYRWESVYCGSYNVTFEPIYLTSYSSGYILDENSTQHTTSFTILKNYLDTYNVNAIPTNGTTFIGWSLYKPDRYTYENVQILTTENLLQYIFNNNNIIIYAIFIKDESVSLDMCFYPTSIGYIATETDKEYYCTICNDVTIVYFDKTAYESSDLENIIWYKDSGLTTVVDSGYYKISTINPPLYRLSGGTAILDQYCSGNQNSCCGDITTTTTSTVGITTTTTTLIPATTTTTTLAPTTTTTTTLVPTTTTTTLAPTTTTTTLTPTTTTTTTITTLCNCASDIKVNSCTTTTGTNVNYPDNIVAGEILLIAVGVNQACSIYTPTDFTYITSVYNNIDSLTTSIFYKVATGSESGSVYVNSNKTTGSDPENLLGASIWRLPTATIYRSNFTNTYENTSYESGTDTISYDIGVRVWVHFYRPLTSGTRTLGGDYCNPVLGPSFGNIIKMDLGCTNTGTKDYIFDDSVEADFLISHLIQFD